VAITYNVLLFLFPAQSLTAQPVRGGLWAFSISALYPEALHLLYVCHQQLKGGRNKGDY
jgi:hypothetical protein